MVPSLCAIDFDSCWARWLWTEDYDGGAVEGGGTWCRSVSVCVAGSDFDHAVSGAGATFVMCPVADVHAWPACDTLSSDVAVVSSIETPVLCTYVEWTEGSSWYHDPVDDVVSLHPCICSIEVFKDAVPGSVRASDYVDMSEK